MSRYLLRRKSVRDWTTEDVATVFISLMLGEHTMAIEMEEVDAVMLQDSELVLCFNRSNRTRGHTDIQASSHRSRSSGG
jgi:uncharacterized protein (DUF305 family)